MAFIRPTLAELVDRIQQDLVSRLGLVSPILRRSLVYVLARVVAGAVHMLHGHIEYLSRQVFPDLSDPEYLIRHAALFGVFPKEASFASRDVEVTGTAGKVIEAETVLLRADGAEYRTDTEVTVGGLGTATVRVTSVKAGAEGSLAEGVPLSFESPIAGVQSTATVLESGSVDGSDAESIASLRERFIERLRNPPHGGNAADYVRWAKEVAGVTRAWCYPTENGAGTVTVRFVRDDDTPSIVPSEAERAAVEAFIREVAPADADVSVKALVEAPLNCTVHLVPDGNLAVQGAVEAELKDLLRRDATPGGTILLSRIRNAIGDAEGVLDYTLTSPTADVTHALDEMPVLGEVTFA